MASPVPYHSKSYSPHSSWIGDFLIVYGKSEEKYPQRTENSPWVGEERRQDWNLYTCKGKTKEWKGSPFYKHNFNGWEFWFLGVQYNNTGLKSSLSRLSRSTDHGAHLNGYFLIFGWEKQKKYWHVWTDRFGSMHAYYLAGSPAAISTYSPALYQLSNKSLDWIGLTGFFSTGIFPQDRTHYENVGTVRN